MGSVVSVASVVSVVSVMSVASTLGNSLRINDLSQTPAFPAEAAEKAT